MSYCKECGNKLVLISGVEEKSKTGITEIDKYVTAYYCESCGIIYDIT